MMARIKWLRCFVPVAACFTMSACNDPTAVLIQGTDAGNATIELSIGQELDVTLGTIGPGSYDSVPSVSSLAVRFLESAVVPPYVPAGPRQRYRLAANQSGLAVITFRHSGTNPVITKTVHVR
jgi:hypothetical protein